MNPILILPLIVGGACGTLMFTILNVGLVGVASPGSIISIMLMSSPGDQLKICLGILVACAITFVLSIPLIKRAGGGDDASLKEAAQTMNELKGKKSRISSVFESIEDFDFSKVTRIAYACDCLLYTSRGGYPAVHGRDPAVCLERRLVHAVRVGHARLFEGHGHPSRRELRGEVD